MTTAETPTPTQYEDQSKLDYYTVAYLRLRDIGITKSQNNKLEGEDAYRRLVALDRMLNTVKMVRRYVSRNPPEIQYQLQLHWYNQFKAADEGQDLYRPKPEQELRKQLLSKEAELRKYKQALTESENRSRHKFVYTCRISERYFRTNI